MATYNIPNYTAKDGFGLPLNIRRGNPNPLDNSSVHVGLAAAQNYAKTDPTAYVGQDLSVINVNAEGTPVSVSFYTIQNEAGDLKEVGTAPVGDGATIDVVDGKIVLHGIKDIEDATKKYQPVLVDGKITWQELSATTVEGLDASLKALDEEVDTLAASVNTNTTNIGNETTRATNRENEIEGALNTYKTNNDARVEAVEKEVDTLQTQIGGLTGAMHFEGVVDAVPENGAEGYAKGDVVVVSTTHKEYVYDGTSWYELGDEGSYLTKTEASTTYETKADAKSKNDTITGALNDEIERAQAAEGANATAIQNLTTTVGNKAEQSVVDTLSETVGTHGTDIQNLKDVGAEKNVINEVDTEQFAIDENRKLTLLEVAQSKVTGLSTALDGKVDKIEGYRLITPDESTKLSKLVLNTDGSVEVSGEVSASNVKELGAWLTQNRDTVDGLLKTTDRELLDDLKDVESGAQVNVIEQISVGGTLLDIVEKKVNIPIADTAKLGVVLSSTAENKVSVVADGTMEVNAINVSKLVQTEGTYIILDGGTSSSFKVTES